LEELTRRQTDVLRAIMDGLSNEEIAQALSVSQQTVKHHVVSIRHRMGIKDGRYCPRVRICFVLALRSGRMPVAYFADLGRPADCPPFVP